MDVPGLRRWPHTGSRLRKGRLLLAFTVAFAGTACGDAAGPTGPDPSRAFSAVAWDCTAQTQIPTAQCEALVALYNATDGPAWANSSGWLQTTTPCSWFGVACSAGGVISLFLDSNRLSGPLPAELGNLSSLQSLVLNRNALTGPIPAALGGLAELRFFLALQNQLTGPIPAAMANLSNLTALSLGGNQLTGSIPSWLADLSNLSTLDLGPNLLTGTIPVELVTLAGLTTLDLEENDLTGPIPPGIGTLSNLQTLALAGNALSGSIPPELGDLTKLLVLLLDRAGLSGEIPLELGNLQDLLLLRLNGNALTGPIPAALGTLTRLVTLDLSSNLLGWTVPFDVARLGGSGPSFCRFRPGNASLFLPDVPAYRALDLDNDGLICGLPFSTDAFFAGLELAKEIKQLLDAGVLNAGQARALDLKVVRSTPAPGGTPPMNATVYLQAFIQQVSDLAADLVLTQAQADTLINLADIMIQLIGGV